jgi:hypothetical protein
MGGSSSIQVFETGHCPDANVTRSLLILSARSIDARCSAHQPAGYKRSRRQRRARVTAALNAAAIVLSLAGIALILVIA